MKKSISILGVITLLLLLVFLFCCVYSYHPTIHTLAEDVSMDDNSVTSPFIRYIMTSLFLLIALSFIKSDNKILFNKTLSSYLLIIILLIFISIAVYVFFSKGFVRRDLLAILTCVGMFFVGWRFTLGNQIYKILFYFYGVLVCYVALMQIIENIGGFVIRDTYFADAKNSLGAMLAVTSVGFMGMARSKTINNKTEKILAYFLGIFSLVEIMTIRARLALISAVIVFLLLFYFSRNKNKNYATSVFITLIVIIILIFILPHSVFDYVYNSIFQNKESDISSGRFDINRMALELFLDDPFVANLRGKLIELRVHNWALKRMYEYGIIIALPFLILYFKMFVSIIRKVFRSYSDTFMIVGYLMILSLFIISLGEPSMPFSPGTAMTPTYFFCGYSFQLLVNVIYYSGQKMPNS